MQLTYLMSIDDPMVRAMFGGGHEAARGRANGFADSGGIRTASIAYPLTFQLAPVRVTWGGV
jgi:hypothetical protein